jgi:NADH:ubiquinone oxidoreductase subunit C
MVPGLSKWELKKPFGRSSQWEPAPLPAGYAVLPLLDGLQLHLRLKTRASEDHLEVPSVVHLRATANWHEREVYDMMGI